MTRKEKIQLKVSDDDDGDIVAYLALPRDRSSTITKKTIRLRDLVGEYTGPDLFFDFDEENVLIGVEVLD